MSSASASVTISSSNFRLILDALDDYTKQTGIDLTTNPFANKLRTCDSSDAILELLREKANQFKDYRDGNRKLINSLSPVVKVVHVFSGILGEAASLMPFQPAKAIFVGVDVLLAAAGAVSASYDALVDLFECISNFLKRLHVYTEIPFTPSMTDVTVKIMVEVLSVLALATKQIKQGRLKKFAKKLLGESEIEAALQRLDRLTQDEAKMAAAQTLVTTQGTANDVNKMKREQLQEKIRNWLCPPDPSKNHNIARRDHHGGTAAWFTTGSSFEKWKSAGSLLWIHGKPGSGKSILCSTIIQEAKRLRDAKLAFMAYYYFDFRDTTKQDLRGLLSSLLAQLSSKSDTFYDILSDLYSTHEYGSQQPDDNALTECLVEMLKRPGQPMIYIIMDGLDECPNVSGMVTPRERVLGLVEELVELELSNLRICVTSRPEADIVDALGPLASFSLSLHEEGGQKQDIVDYVSSAVKTDRKMRRWRAEDKDLVIDSLSQKADGMFRWVVCQLETLRHSFPAAIRRALEELPESLDETYERALLGIEKEKREYAHRLFQCLTVSVRPLHVEELAEVLAVRFDTGKIPQYHAGWRPEDAQDAVLSACSSLITIVNMDRSPVVQFSHFSVKEFLTSDRLATAGENLSRYHVDPESAHTVLVKACLSVLLELDDKVDREGIKNFPLANYAARHWVDHAQFKNVSSGVQGMMERLFDQGKSQFATWVWIFDPDRPWSWVKHMSTVRPTSPKAKPLYYAALCGFLGLVDQFAVACPGDVNDRGGYHGTPLLAAFSKENLAVSLRLLEHGADINALDNDGLNPLQRASRSGRGDIVQVLLEHHVDLGKTTADEETALHLASGCGEIEVVRLLLQHGASIDPRDKKGWTPLMAASRLGHLDVVQLLLQSGAAVDLCDNERWSPLHTASRHGHLHVLRALLQSGADVNLQNGQGWTPLQLATRYEYAEMVDDLLNNGADVNVQKDDLWAPLHQASSNLQITQLLVQRGAIIDVKNEERETPLDLASSHGELEVVRFLIKSGANVNCEDKRGWTPLHTASHSGHLNIVELLLQSGTDINVRNGSEETPLRLASVSGKVEVARFLIEKGANVNSRDEKGWTSLHAASYNGHLDVAELLLRSGLDVNIRNGNEESPLDVSSYKGNLKVARLLIENGADVNSRDGKGWSPLHSAAANGHLDVVKLLIEKGADVYMRNSTDQTPFDMASRNRKHEVARFLARHMGDDPSGENMGLTVPDSDLASHSHNGHSDVVQSSSNDKEEEDANSSDGNEEVSLHTASEKGRVEVVQSLLDNGAEVNQTNEFHRTPLDVASMNGKLEVVRLLIKRGADVEARTNNGWTPLHKASRYGHLDVVRFLLDHGADVNAKQRKYWTPLHLASSNGHLEIVILLVERGAAVDVLNDNGRTPSREAIANGFHNIGQLLLQYDRRGV